MKFTRNILTLLVAVCAFGLLADQFAVGRGPGGKGGHHKGKGMSQRGGGGRGAANDPTKRADMQDIHYLLANRKQIRRRVMNLPNGVRTLTESNNPQVAKRIQKHVHTMHNRVVTRRPIHLRDPLFRVLFANAGQIKMSVRNTAKGVQVEQIGRTPLAAKLVQAHAAVLSLFIANGHAEVRKNHPVPN